MNLNVSDGTGLEQGFQVGLHAGVPRAPRQGQMVNGNPSKKGMGPQDTFRQSHSRTWQHISFNQRIRRQWQKHEKGHLSWSNAFDVTTAWPCILPSVKPTRQRLFRLKTNRWACGGPCAWVVRAVHTYSGTNLDASLQLCKGRAGPPCQSARRPPPGKSGEDTGLRAGMRGPSREREEWKPQGTVSEAAGPW